MNLATFHLDDAAVTAREIDAGGTGVFIDAPGDGTISDPRLGCNTAGSCAPGIGIATDVINPSKGTGCTAAEDAEDEKVAWTVLDQGQDDNGATPLARDPQVSQHIGGSGLGLDAGLTPTDVSSGGTEGLATVDPIKAHSASGDTIDIDDTLTYITAITGAAPGEGFGALDADPENRGTGTIAIGDEAWGVNAVP